MSDKPQAPGTGWPASSVSVPETVTDETAGADAGQATMPGGSGPGGLARRRGAARHAAHGAIAAAILAAAVASVLAPAGGEAVLIALLVAAGGVVVMASKRDAAAVLTAMLALLFLVPEDYVFVGPLRSVGYPAMLVALGALAMWLVGRALGHLPRPANHPVHWLALGHLLVAATAFAAAMTRALTTIESTGATRSVFPVLAEVGIALLACDAIVHRRRLDALLYRLVVIVGIASVIGITEFVFTTFHYVTAVHVPGLTINVQLIQDVRSSFRRVQGAAAHPIEYAVAIAAMVPMGLHYASHAPSRAGRQLAGLATLAMLVVLPMTVSRSAVLAVAVAIVVYGAHWSVRTRINALVLALLGLVGFRAAVPGLLGTLRSLFTSASTDPSVLHRTNDYARIPGLMQGHWLFGRGLGTFQPAQYFFLDNQYIGSLLEGGLIELAMLITLLVVGMGIARGARKAAADSATRSLGQAIAAGIASIAASAATFDELAFKQTAFLLFLFIGCAGALWRMARTREHDDTASPEPEPEVECSRTDSSADPGADDARNAPAAAPAELPALPTPNGDEPPR